MLMQGLLPRESVDELQNYRGGTIGIEHLLDGLGNHGVYDLGRDGDCCPLVVGYDAEELEVEDVEGVGDLRDRDLLQQRLAQYGHWDRLYLSEECQEVPHQVLPDLDVWVKLNQQESERLVDYGSELVSIHAEML